MSMKYVKSVAVLSAICLILAAALGAVNMLTSSVIEAAEIEAVNKALAEVREGAEKFTKIDISSYGNLPATVTEAYSADDIGGFVVKLTTKGYASGLVIMVGIDGEGVVTGTKVLSSGETLGEEKTYGENLIGSDIESVDGVATVSGATMTTGAYKNAVKDALSAADIFGAVGGA